MRLTPLQVGPTRTVTYTKQSMVTTTGTQMQIEAPEAGCQYSEKARLHDATTHWQQVISALAAGYRRRHHFHYGIENPYGELKYRPFMQAKNGHKTYQWRADLLIAAHSNTQRKHQCHFGLAWQIMNQQGPKGMDDATMVRASKGKSILKRICSTTL